MSNLPFARSILADEAGALAQLAAGLDQRFDQAVELLVACANQGGTVLVTGLGKSGLIGAKISATLASLGIPSHLVHPSEAAHGDLGRFRSTDTVIAISFSGETDEVVGVAGILRQDGLPIVSITGGTNERAASSLERLATVALRLGVTHEAGKEHDARLGEDHFIAPTCSTTATLALGDALALCAARVRNFTSQDFARRHPGGALGGLLRPVTDVMRAVAGKNLPLIDDGRTVAQALQEASAVARRSGALLLVDASGRLSGLITDGDVRRLVLRDRAALDRPAREVMTRGPRTLLDAALVRDAVAMIREHRQDEIPIVDAEGRPVGLLDVQDLIAMRLIKD
jgi:arabinose-5-phosphate isomerase